jgi:ornithine cyclodeaminase/alanine dehydrogenase-like protein (mu-crystallin family)
VNPLYLTEQDVLATLTMTDALRLVDEAARALAEGAAENRPRQRVRTGNTILHVLPAAMGGRLGHKSYTGAPRPRGARFWYYLYAESGELLAVMEADHLGRIRTGAASGVATRVLAREDARTVAVIGTGSQAPTQVEAICAVRPIARVLAWGRDADRLSAFCEAAAARCGVPVLPAPTPQEAVASADIVATITSARTPVLFGSWLQPGTHVNAAGSNRANAQEIDVEAVRRAAVVAVEDIAQAKVESGDLRAANETSDWDWKDAVRLSDVVAGHALGRTGDEQITLFESLGIGLWDLASASHVYDACLAAGRGSRLPIPS